MYYIEDETTCKDTEYISGIVLVLENNGKVSFLKLNQNEEVLEELASIIFDESIISVFEELVNGKKM